MVDLGSMIGEINERKKNRAFKPYAFLYVLVLLFLVGLVLIRALWGPQRVSEGTRTGISGTTQKTSGTLWPQDGNF